MAINTKKPASMTAEEVADWEAKDKYKRKVKIKKFPVDPDDLTNTETSDFWIVEPDRVTATKVADMSRAHESAGKVNDLTLNTCILAGDMERLEWDDPLMWGVLSAITDLSTVKKSV